VIIEKGELATSIKEKKEKVKTKFIDFDHAGNDKLLLNRLLLSLECWLMLEQRFCAYNVGLKVEILMLIMTSNDENIRSCKRHTAVRHAFCFW